MDKRYKPRTPEVKEKIYKALLGKKHPPERVEANRRGHLGLRHSPETIKKMKGHIPWNKGKITPPETREKQRQAAIGRPGYWKGKKRPEISARQKGKIPVEAIEASAKARRGKSLSKERRKKISKSLSGEKSHLWRGGITPKNLKIRNGIEFRLWREAVFKRDNWTCQECGERGGKLNAHHIKSFSKNPSLRFDVKNGVTLCVNCHKLTESWAKG